MLRIRGPLSTVLAVATLAASAQAQIFVRNTTDVPDQAGGANRYTENVDFGDVDLDGDFDAALCRGGDFGNLQDRLWVNPGGRQGGNLANLRQMDAIIATSVCLLALFGSGMAGGVPFFAALRWSRASRPCLLMLAGALLEPPARVVTFRVPPTVKVPFLTSPVLFTSVALLSPASRVTLSNVPMFSMFNEPPVAIA